VTTERKARIMEFDESRSIENVPLLIKCLSVLALVVAGFLFHGPLGLEASSIALLGAAALLLLSGKREPDEYYREVEWGTIFFFIGLFILVGGMVELGVIKLLARKVMGLTRGDLRLTSVVVLWVSGVFSAVVDNIPYVATMIPLLQDILSSTGHEAALPLWWSLSLGACLGGNGTLVGASANVVAAGLSTKSGYRISFLEFTRYGALYTLVSMALSTVYILLRYY